MLDDSFLRPYLVGSAVPRFLSLLCAAATLLLGSSSQLHLPCDVTEQRGRTLACAFLSGACDQRNILRCRSISPLPSPCHCGTCHLRVRCFEVSMVGGSAGEDLCHLSYDVQDLPKWHWQLGQHSLSLLAIHMVTNPDRNVDRVSLAVGRGDREHTVLLPHCSSSAVAITPKQCLAGKGSIFPILVFESAALPSSTGYFDLYSLFPLRTE